eukprot:TRINITY_DN15521_c0_g1_i1.p2 TRINITY_DN15521_c0_g1~~TRINITY_DN15521_c0_g1_i1.p2  ORF type:complete len:53 (-),score=5.23 TRINITY_DN15521_c0_g1_i1:136-294(-)
MSCVMNPTHIQENREFQGENFAPEHPQSRANSRKFVDLHSLSDSARCSIFRD